MSTCLTFGSWHRRFSLKLGKTFDYPYSPWPRSGVVIESSRPWRFFLEAFLISTGIVALAEIGDKTQLLAFILAARFRKPSPIMLGILLATVVNHAVAAFLGSWMSSLLSPMVLRWTLGISFLAMAVWILIPDRLNEEETKLGNRGILGVFGIFSTTFLAFFLAETGDKTQIATVALAAQYQAFLAVIAGTTLGMMIANVPAVLLGNKITRYLPVRLVHTIAAVIFAVLGILTLMGAGARLGF